MFKVLPHEIRTNHNCNKEKIEYKTPIPIHLLDCSLYELNNEIKENNFGGMEFSVEFNKWTNPIINLDLTYDVAFRSIWDDHDGKFGEAKKDYTDIVSVVIAGYREENSVYYSERNRFVRFFVVPSNEDTAEGKQTKLSLDVFEKYPAYYEITKKTKKTFTFRYPYVLDCYPMSLESRPMLLPLEYLQQEFCMNAYVGEKVKRGVQTYDERLPVVRFWEEIDGELQPQFYTYEYKELKKNQYKQPIERMVEVSLKKVNPDDVQYGYDWFYVTKKFLFE